MTLKQIDGFVVPPGAGPTWDMAAGRPAVFKLLSDDTGGSLSVFEETVPPGSGTSVHRHHAGDEVIHIVAGEFVVRLGQANHPASAGSWVFIPRGASHAWRNVGSEPGRAFFIFTGTGAKAIEEMRHHQRPIAEIDRAVRDETNAQYGYETVSLEWV